MTTRHTRLVTALENPQVRILGPSARPHVGHRAPASSPTGASFVAAAAADCRRRSRSTAIRRGRIFDHTLAALRRRCESIPPGSCSRTVLTRRATIARVAAIPPSRRDHTLRGWDGIAYFVCTRAVACAGRATERITSRGWRRPSADLRIAPTCGVSSTTPRWRAMENAWELRQLPTIPDEVNERRAGPAVSRSGRKLAQ